MNEVELAIYRLFVFDRDYPGDRECFLCRDRIARGDSAYMVPTSCDDTHKMHRGEPYAYQLAHRRCMARVP
jgi:hypothetical protein